jgi:hypothetical protein
VNKILICALAVLSLCTLSSCGYRGEESFLQSRYSSITVPFVEGDEDGSLTSAIVRELSVSSPIPYSQNGGDLILRVKILDIDDDNVGYRYDRKKRGTIRKRLIPCETRLTVNLEVGLENRCGELVLPRVIIIANQDFDHDYYTTRNFDPENQTTNYGVNIFSLGQLSEIDAARDTVITPINAIISKKIVDYLSDSW